VEQVAGGPWERAGVDRETWYAVRMMAAAIRETARLPINATEKNAALPADHERLGEYADRIVSAVEAGTPRPSRCSCVANRAPGVRPLS
jgi:hypothetical protein